MPLNKEIPQRVRQTIGVKKSNHFEIVDLLPQRTSLESVVADRVRVLDSLRLSV
jgi:hypothetical protein